MAQRTGQHVSAVRNVIIWGNHSSSQFPDVAHGSVAGQAIRAAVGDEGWLRGEFISTVQQRGAAIIKAGGACDCGWLWCYAQCCCGCCVAAWRQGAVLLHPCCSGCACARQCLCWLA